MRNSTGTIVVSVMVGLLFLVSAVNGERAEPPRIYYEEIDKRDFPCSEKWWQFSLTRDRIFRSLGLTEEQREEIKRLRKQFRDDLLDFKRRHNESLLNILDDTQRLKLEEKSGEIDRYLKDRVPYQQRRRHRPDRYPFNGDDKIHDSNILEVDVSRILLETNIDPITWGIIKKDFKE